MAEGFVETNGVRLWYEQRGEPDGAPVVLVMGVGASAIWWPPELVDALIDAGYGWCASTTATSGCRLTSTSRGRRTAPSTEDAREALERVASSTNARGRRELPDPARPSAT